MATVSIGEIEATLRLRDELTAQLRMAQQHLAKTGDALQNIGRRGKEAGTAMTLGLTVPLVSAAAAALKFSTDFQTAMVRVGTLTNIGIEGIGDLQKQIIKLSPAVGIGPTKLAEGLLVVASTGLRAEAAMEVLEHAAKASAVGMGETADIARSVTAAIVAYGEESLTAEEATNKLFVAVREGGAEATEFAGTLGRVVGIASQVGVSFDEVLASMATFTRLGVKADEAATALRGVLGTLLKPSNEAREQLLALGTSIEELRDKVARDGLTKALIDLVKATEGNEDALAAIIPNIRALAGVMGTAGSQAEGFQEVLDNIKNGTVELNEAFKIVTDTLGFKWKAALAKAQGVLLQFGDAIAPTFGAALEAAEPLLNVVSALAKVFASLPGPVKTAAVAFGALLAAAGPLVYVISSVIQLTGFATTALAFLTRAFGASATAAGVHAAAMTANATATAAFGAATKTFAAADLVSGMSAVGRSAGLAATAVSSVVKPAADLSAMWQITQTTGLLAAGSFKNVAAGMTAAGRAAAQTTDATRILTATGIANAVTYTKVAAGMSAAGRSASTTAPLIVGMGAAGATAAKSMGALQLAMAFLAGPGLIIAGIVAIGAALNSLTRGMAELPPGLKALQDELDKTAAKAKDMEAAAARVAGLRDAIRGLTKLDVDDLTTTVKDLAREGQLSEAAMKRVAARAKELEADGNKLTEELKQVVRWVDMATAAATPAAASFKTFGAELAAAKKEMAAFTAEQRKEIQAGLAMGKSTEDIAKHLKLSQVAVDLYAEGLENATKAMEDATKAGIEQWESMEKIRESLMETVPQLEKWQRGWNTAGRDVSKTTGLLRVVPGHLTAVGIGFQANTRQVLEFVAAGRLASAAFAQMSNLGSLAGTAFEDRATPITRPPTLDNDWFVQMRKDTEEATEKAKTFDEQLDDLAQTFAHLAQISGGTFGGIVRDIGNIIATLALARRSMEAFRDAATNTDRALALVGGATALIQATGQGSTAARTAGGALTGAEIGSSLAPPGFEALGGVIGGVVGGLVGLMRGLFGVSEAVKKARGEQDELIASLRKMGIAGNRNFDVLANAAQRAAVLMGKSGEEARESLEALMDTDNPERFRRELARVNAVLEHLTELVDRYALTWLDLASDSDRMQGFSAEIVNLVNDFNILQRAGYSTTEILKRMGPDFVRALRAARESGVLDRFIDDLVRTGRISQETGDALRRIGGPDFRELTERAERYGITLQQLGPQFQQAHIDDIANTYLTDFNDLVEAGGDVNGVMLGMRDEVNKLLRDAERFGSSLPEAMRPMLQSFLDAGLLVDADGRKLETLAGFSFEDSPLEQGIAGLTQAINELILTLGGVPGALANIGRTRVPTIVVPWKYQQEGGGIPGVPGGGGTTTAPVPPPLPPTPPLEPTEPAPRPGLGIEEESIIFDWRRYDPDYFGATGGLITQQGLQQFATGGTVLPFKPKWPDTVPIMAAPGETLRTPDQEAELWDWMGAQQQGEAPVYSGSVKIMVGSREIGEVSLAYLIERVSRHKGDGEVLIDLIRDRMEGAA